MPITRALVDDEKEALLADGPIKCPHLDCERPVDLAELITGVDCPACGNWYELSLFYGDE